MTPNPLAEAPFPSWCRTPRASRRSPPRRTPSKMRCEWRAARRAASPEIALPQIGNLQSSIGHASSPQRADQLVELQSQRFHTGVAHGRTERTDAVAACCSRGRRPRLAGWVRVGRDHRSRLQRWMFFGELGSLFGGRNQNHGDKILTCRESSVMILRSCSECSRAVGGWMNEEIRKAGTEEFCFQFFSAHFPLGAARRVHPGAVLRGGRPSK